MIDRFIEKKILPLACMLLAIFKKKKPVNDKNREILIIRLWALGESVLVLPMLKSLKEAKPSSVITVLCTKKTDAVFYKQSFIDGIQTINSLAIPLFILKNFKKYDVVIDTEPHFAISAILSFFLGKTSIGYNHGSRARLYDFNIEYNDKQHVVYTISDLLLPFGIKSRPKELVRLKFDVTAKNMVDQKLANTDLKKPLVGIHAFTGPTAPWRAWSKEHFAELIDRIKEKYSCNIILTGSAGESAGNDEIISMLKDKSDVLNLSNLSSPVLFALISRYSLMISNDTGPMHVAAAQGVPTVGLFGPNLPLRFGPFPPEKHASIYHKVECSPCINVHLNEFRKCPYDGKCMKLITVDEVFASLERLFTKSNKKIGQTNSGGLSI